MEQPFTGTSTVSLTAPPPNTRFRPPPPPPPPSMTSFSQNKITNQSTPSDFPTIQRNEHPPTPSNTPGIHPQHSPNSPDKHDLSTTQISEKSTLPTHPQESKNTVHVISPSYPFRRPINKPLPPQISNISGNLTISAQTLPSSLKNTFKANDSQSILYNPDTRDSPQCKNESLKVQSPPPLTIDRSNYSTPDRQNYELNFFSQSHIPSTIQDTVKRNSFSPTPLIDNIVEPQYNQPLINNYMKHEANQGNKSKTINSSINTPMIQSQIQNQNHNFSSPVNRMPSNSRSIKLDSPKQAVPIYSYVPNDNPANEKMKEDISSHNDRHHTPLQRKYPGQENKDYFVKSIRELSSILNKRVHSIEHKLPQTQTLYQPPTREHSYVPPHINRPKGNIGISHQSYIEPSPSLVSFDQGFSQMDYADLLGRELQPFLEKMSQLEKRFISLENTNIELIREAQRQQGSIKQIPNKTYNQEEKNCISSHSYLPEETNFPSISSVYNNSYIPDDSTRSIYQDEDNSNYKSFNKNNFNSFSNKNPSEEAPIETLYSIKQKGDTECIQPVLDITALEEASNKIKSSLKDINSLYSPQNKDALAKALREASETQYTNVIEQISPSSRSIKSDNWVTLKNKIESASNQVLNEQTDLERFKTKIGELEKKINMKEEGLSRVLNQRTTVKHTDKNQLDNIRNRLQEHKTYLKGFKSSTHKKHFLSYDPNPSYVPNPASYNTLPNFYFSSLNTTNSSFLDTAFSSVTNSNKHLTGNTFDSSIYFLPDSSYNTNSHPQSTSSFSQTEVSSHQLPSETGDKYVHFSSSSNKPFAASTPYISNFSYNFCTTTSPATDNSTLLANEEYKVPTTTHNDFLNKASTTNTSNKTFESNFEPMMPQQNSLTVPMVPTDTQAHPPLEQIFNDEYANASSLASSLDEKGEPFDYSLYYSIYESKNTNPFNTSNAHTLNDYSIWNSETPFLNKSQEQIQINNQQNIETSRLSSSNTSYEHQNSTNDITATTSQPLDTNTYTYSSNLQNTSNYSPHLFSQKDHEESMTNTQTYQGNVTHSSSSTLYKSSHSQPHKSPIRPPLNNLCDLFDNQGSDYKSQSLSFLPPPASTPTYSQLVTTTVYSPDTKDFDNHIPPSQPPNTLSSLNSLSSSTPTPSPDTEPSYTQPHVSMQPSQSPVMHSSGHTNFASTSNYPLPITKPPYEKFKLPYTRPSETPSTPSQIPYTQWTHAQSMYKQQHYNPLQYPQSPDQHITNTQQLPQYPPFIQTTNSKITHTTPASYNYAQSNFSREHNNQHSYFKTEFSQDNLENPNMLSSPTPPTSLYSQISSTYTHNTTSDGIQNRNNDRKFSNATSQPANTHTQSIPTISAYKQPHHIPTPMSPSSHIQPPFTNTQPTDSKYPTPIQSPLIHPANLKSSHAQSPQPPSRPHLIPSPFPPNHLVTIDNMNNSSHISQERDVFSISSKQPQTPLNTPVTSPYITSSSQTSHPPLSYNTPTAGVVNINSPALENYKNLSPIFEPQPAEKDVYTENKGSVNTLTKNINDNYTFSKGNIYRMEGSSFAYDEMFDNISDYSNKFPNTALEEQTNRQNIPSTHFPVHNNSPPNLSSKKSLANLFD